MSQIWFYGKASCPVLCSCLFPSLHSRIFFHTLSYLNGCGKALQLVRHIWCFFLSKGKPSCETWAAWAVQCSLTSPFRSSVPQFLKQLWVEGLRGGFDLPPQHQGQAQTVGKHSRHWRRKDTAQPSSATDLYYLFFSETVGCFPHLFFSAPMPWPHKFNSLFSHLFCLMMPLAAGFLSNSSQGIFMSKCLFEKHLCSKLYK